MIVNGKNIDAHSATGTLWFYPIDKTLFLFARFNVDKWGFVSLTEHSNRFSDQQNISEIQGLIDGDKLQYIGRIEELDIESFLAEKDLK
jgi:hypothetical protein